MVSRHTYIVAVCHHFCVMMNDHVRSHVVAMLNDRVRRAALGYAVDTCIQYKIVPCTLLIPELFKAHLSYLCSLRLRGQCVIVYNEHDNIQVKVGFVSGRESPHFLQIWVEVTTKVVVSVMSETQSLSQYHHEGSVTRTQYLSPFTGLMFFDYAICYDSDSVSVLHGRTLRSYSA